MQRTSKNISPAIAFIGIFFILGAASCLLYNGYLGALLIFCSFVILGIVAKAPAASVSKISDQSNKIYPILLRLRDQSYTAVVVITGLIVFCDLELGYLRIFGLILTFVNLYYFHKQNKTQSWSFAQHPVYNATLATILIFALGLAYLSNQQNSYAFFSMLLIALCLTSMTIQLYIHVQPPPATSEKYLQFNVSPHAGVFAGKVNGKDIYISTQERAIVIGPPGTGKTALLVTQLLHWIKTKRSFICLDIKPELYGILRETLAKHDYQVRVYNPTANAGDRYNPLSDIQGTESIAELSAALITSEGADNKVFHENARDFLDAIISHLKITQIPSLPAIRDFVMRYDTYKDSLLDLARSPDKNVVEIAKSLLSAGTNERLLGTIFAVFKTNLRYLRHDAIRDSLAQSDFSLADFCQSQRPTALFLQFVETHQQTTAGLLSMMVGHIIRYLIAHTERGPVLLMLDEIGNAPVIAGLLQKLNTMRSREIPTWLYWQSIEQMQKYGQKHDEGPNVIMGSADVKIVFRLNDNKTAKWISEHINDQEVIVDSISVSQSMHQHTQTISKHLMVEPIVRPRTLTTLANSQTVLIYKGQAQTAIATPYFNAWPQFKGIKLAPADKIGKPYDSAN